MPDPGTREEYERLFVENHKTRGYGEETVQSFPCPFCAESDWFEASAADMAHSTDDIHCSECGRSARFIYTEAEPARATKDRLTGETVMTAGRGSSIELVQTFGPDAPPWMSPAPRRAEPSR